MTCATGPGSVTVDGMTTATSLTAALEHALDALDQGDGAAIPPADVPGLLAHRLADDGLFIPVHALRLALEKVLAEVERDGYFSGTPALAEAIALALANVDPAVARHTGQAPADLTDETKLLLLADAISHSEQETGPKVDYRAQARVVLTYLADRGWRI